MSAIVKSESLALAESKVKEALVAFAQALAVMEKAEQPAALDVITQLKKVSEEVYDRLRGRVLDQTILEGQKITEKGTYEANISGWVMRAIPTKTGTDPKKLEARIRACGLNPANYMDPTITYKVNATKLAGLVAEGKFTYADVAYDPAYRVQLERSDAG